MDATGISVRPARPSDFAIVGELLAEGFAAQAGERAERRGAKLRGSVARRARHGRILVATEGDAVLGCAIYVVPGRFRRNPLVQLARRGEAEVRLLAVTTEARGRGIALALMRACIEEARQRGRVRLVASNDPANTASHRLDLAAGLARCPERDWKGFDGRDVWAWTIAL